MHHQLWGGTGHTGPPARGSLGRKGLAQGPLAVQRQLPAGLCRLGHLRLDPRLQKQDHNPGLCIKPGGLGKREARAPPRVPGPLLRLGVLPAPRRAGPGRSLLGALGPSRGAWPGRGDLASPC